MILTYTKEHNFNKLNDELMQLEFLKPHRSGTEEDGVTFIAFIKSIGDNIELRIEKELTQEQIELIDAVINKHNPIVIKEPTLEERLNALEIMELERLLGGM